MPELNNLSKKERKFLRRQQREQEKIKNKRERKIKKLSVYGLVLFLVGGAIFGGGWWIFQQEPIPESKIISKQGLHWHADLTIKILGEFQDIPANIGIGIANRYIHTHEPDGVIHMEFPRSVKQNDIRLSQFFEIWGKKFNKDCIFDKCVGPDNLLTMLVNAEENFEFENYIMQDNDKIEIIFEQK